MPIVTVQLLHKFSIRATENSMKLLKVIKNPVTEHLPVGCLKIGTSFAAEKVVNPRDIVPPDDPITIVVGAIARGQVSLSVKSIYYFLQCEITFKIFHLCNLNL